MVDLIPVYSKKSSKKSLLLAIDKLQKDLIEKENKNDILNKKNDYLNECLDNQSKTVRELFKKVDDLKMTNSTNEIIITTLMSTMSKPKRNNPDTEYIVLKGDIYRVLDFNIHCEPEDSSVEIFAKSVNVKLKDETSRLSNSSGK